MFKAFSLTVCLLLLLLVIAAGLHAEDITCRNYSSDGFVRPLVYQQIIDFNRLKNIQIRCLEDYSGDYRVQHVNGFTIAEFDSNAIEVFISSELIDHSFTLTLIHELTHVEQYMSWMNGVQNENGMDEKLNIIHKLVEPQGLNASFQTMAKMNRYSAFRKNTRSWFKAYVDMQFCMEFQAYNNELRYVELSNINANQLPGHLRALKEGDQLPLLDLLNTTLIKRLNDSEYTEKELKRAFSVCGLGRDPVGWFSASAEALNLVDKNDSKLSELID